MTLKLPFFLGAAVAVVVVGATCSNSTSGPGGTPAPAIQKAATASGDAQTAQVGTALPNPLRVLVTLSGAPRPGDSVTWAASGTGASVSPTRSITDASGIATTTWTLGSTVGSQSATATLSGATGSPVTFTATATAAPVPLIQKSPTASGDAQTGVVATALANPLRVLVTLSGTPQLGDTVTWAAAGTGASVSPTKSVTDATGIATTIWTLGQVAGTQNATATLTGATGSPVTFAATATAGPATQLSLSSGDNQTGPPSSTLANPLKVKVGDQFGNGVSGVSVSWLVTSGSAAVGSASSTSDATGIAQTTVTLGGSTGSVTISATSTGLVGSPVTFHATVAALAASAAVQLGDDFFKSVANGSQNPAVDTIAVGGTVTWTWVGSLGHSVESLGSPSFTSSAIKTSGTYAFTFTTAGTYQYDCIVHGLAMRGTVVVR